MVFYVASAFSIVGAILTYFMIPDMSTDLNVEDQAFDLYLASQGIAPIDTPSQCESVDMDEKKDLQDIERTDESVEDEKV
jgi:hypothetical protein